MKKIIHFLKFASIYLLIFNWGVLMGQDKNSQVIDLLGREVNFDNTSANGDIIYQSSGIVVYENFAASFSKVEADGACLSANGQSYGRCASFYVPATYKVSKFIPYGWIQFTPGGSTCLPAQWSWSLKNSAGNTLPEPYVVQPGQTYTFCLNSTLALSTCQILKMCLAPYLVPINARVEHYLADDEYPPLRSNEEGGNFKVCADGSSASKFRLTDYEDATNISIKIDEDPSGLNEAVYGKFISSNVTSLGKDFVYKHPTHMSSSNKFRQINVTLYNTITNTNLTTFQVNIYKPPLIMIHGLNSKGTSFNTMRNDLLLNYPEELLVNVDYESTNASHFATNSTVIPNYISNLKIKLKGLDYAFQKVDLVGHSMGGILSRLYLQANTTNRNNVNKLITINTPHSGSQMADLLFDSNLRLDLKTLSCYFMKCGNGAINDLRVNSSAIDIDLNGFTRTRNNVPSHAIATRWILSPQLNDGQQIVQRIVARYLIQLALDLGTYYTHAFSGEASDLIVKLDSQFGGMPVSCRSVYDSQIHIGAQENQEVINRVRELLNLPPNSSSFCNGFNPPNLTYNPLPLLFDDKSETNTSITVNKPVNNQKVKINTSLLISAQGSNVSSMDVYVGVDENLMYKYTFSGTTINTSIEIDNTYKNTEIPIIIIGRNSNGTIASEMRTVRIRNCSENLNLTGKLNSGIYEAKQIVQTNGIISFANKVELIAGKSVILKPGFESESFSNTKISIEDCN